MLLLLIIIIIILLLIVVVSLLHRRRRRDITHATRGNSRREEYLVLVSFYSKTPVCSVCSNHIHKLLLLLDRTSALQPQTR